jgi:hypothetical protein
MQTRTRAAAFAAAAAIGLALVQPTGAAAAEQTKPTRYAQGEVIVHIEAPPPKPPADLPPQYNTRVSLTNTSSP